MWQFSSMNINGLVLSAQIEKEAIFFYCFNDDNNIDLFCQLSLTVFCVCVCLWTLKWKQALNEIIKTERKKWSITTNSDLEQMFEQMKTWQNIVIRFSLKRSKRQTFNECFLSRTLPKMVNLMLPMIETS